MLQRLEVVMRLVFSLSQPLSKTLPPDDPLASLPQLCDVRSVLKATCNGCIL